VHLLNPFNEHGLGTARFNPLAHLSIDNPNLGAEVAGIAEALILSQGREPYFDDTARTLVKTIILHLIATKGNAATLPEMRRLLTLLAEGPETNRKAAELLLELSESPYPFISQPAGRFKRDTRDIASAINTAITQTDFLDDPMIARSLSGSDFTMLDLKRGITTLYVVLPANKLDAYARFFRLLVVSAIDQLTSTPGGVRTLLMLDEFARLGHLSAIENAFGLAAGYNVQLWPFLQDLNQLKDIYANRWETFLANAGAIQVFTPNDMFTAEYFSKRCGTYTKEIGSRQQHEISEGQFEQGFTGETKSASSVGVPLMRPQDFLGMDKATQIVFFSSSAKPFRLLRTPYFLDTKFKALADADPFHFVG
jgi:type IV secretion system protein VirD4